MSAEKWEDNEEIKIFREYLRIPSVHPDIDYTACVEFIKRQADSLGLPVDVVCPAVKSKPVVIVKWLGEQPELPSIILNSHMDVVPVFSEKWTHEPFSADIDEQGRIFARGTQDMKSVGTQYLGAIRLLKASGFQPKRTVHVTFVPDEEIGGSLGMAEFVKTDFYKQMNVGFSLDEGGTSASDVHHLFYAERIRWVLKLKLGGTAGHGSLLLPNTAGVKLNYVLNKLSEFRESQVQRLINDKSVNIGDVTTVNLTQLSGGVQSNVVPPLFEAIFDMRLSITLDLVAFEKQIRDWCEEAGGGIQIEFTQKEAYVAPTKMDDSNPYWIALKAAIDELSSYPFGRYSGVNAACAALGLLPINHTPILLHNHNKCVQADSYLQGIGIYKELISLLY
ncbi:hypothetical protein M5D96_001900 [Drosophila gunungcola]|uniref:Peptidase M20 dimerisation domain-containing protein n=1 Tax=Drosophila gunungcola TaxID=103775 RepID=A0A9P9YYZ8_9MUSC|nr:hypothetical protein M5D96_001900 [Drosophila gunungcola]